MGDDIDVHIGKRVRRRRRLLGLTQQQLAGACGVRFQQIQKYECGANRVSAARLWRLSRALEVPVGYFFDGLEGVQPSAEDGDIMRNPASRGERPRRPLLDLAKTLRRESDAA